MPVTYEIIGDALALRMAGEYEPADIRAAVAAALTAAGAGGLRAILFDVSQSTALRRRNAKAVRAMASFLGHVAQQHHLRIALIGSSDLAFGLMRLGAADLDAAGVTASVFRREAEAQQWLATP